MDSKDVLRTSTRVKRDKLDATYRQTAEASINTRLNQTPEIISANTIATYVSYQSEVDTSTLISQWLSQQKRIVIPKIMGNDISFFEIKKPDEIAPGYKGVPEPKNVSSPINPPEIDVCIVPGLAFDVNGYRLGYGKGFYDRFLATYFGLSIGICFTNQLFYEIPHSQTDIPVRRIITDTVTVQTPYQPLHI